MALYSPTSLRCASQWTSTRSCVCQWLKRRATHPYPSAASTRLCAAAAVDVKPTGPAVTAGAGVQGNVIQALRERGLIQEVTSENLEKLVETESITVYCGFDPTADSLHLGNLLGIIVLSWFQLYGHTPVALLGGATGRVGDPSGRSSERPLLSEEQLEANIQAIGKLLQGILERNQAPGKPQVKLANNLDWFGSMSFLAFLRDIGKYARVGTMLAKDSVRTRMESEQGISFTEFTYQLLQGYDFVHLHKTQGVRVQVGGSDQWGNITAGTDLVRRLLGTQDIPAPECYGLTFPLLVDAQGRKVGKSTGGAVWLAGAKLSPYHFYQHLFQIQDADVIRFLKMLTFLPVEEIDKIEASMSAPGYVPNTAQKRLAEEVTRFVHGEEGLQQALKTTEALRPGSSTKLDSAALEAIAKDAPKAEAALADVQGKLLVDVATSLKLLASKGEVRRMIKNGGLYLNNAKVTDDKAVITDEDIIDGKWILFAAGKKNKLLVKILS